MGARRWSRSIGEARRWALGDPAWAGLGLYALRPPGAGLIRGVDLTTAAATRLERLRQVVEQRGRRGLDVAPPLIRAGGRIPPVTPDKTLEKLFTPPPQ